MPILFLIFIVVPIIEISVLIHIGKIIGGFNTIALMLLTAAIGSYFVKKEGLCVLQNAQSKLQQNQLPAKELITGVCLMVAGVLLITPGFITDIIGCLLVIPPTRALISAIAIKRFSVHVANSAYRSQAHHQANQYGNKQHSGQNNERNNGQGEVFEGEFTEHSSNPVIESKEDKDESKEQKDENNERNL